MSQRESEQQTREQRIDRRLESAGWAVCSVDAPVASFASYLIRVRFAEGVVLPEFANHWLDLVRGRRWPRLAKTDGVSQSNIEGSKLARMPIPGPPIAEQREIVHRVSAVSRRTDDLLGRIDHASRAIGRSSHALPVKAFRGELSPGDRK